MKILGIESSCDETAAAIVEDGHRIISNVVATQIPFHQIYKGVVPEIASRKHAEWILPVVRQALAEANMTLADVDAVAATNRPGLMGSLLIGLTFGKTLAWTAGKPFIAINISPGCTFLESFSMLGISNSISPLAFKFSNPANIDFNFINFSLFIYFFIVII